jgi:protein-S-isoprenylcysteine O-methyltransferase Ste14
MDRNTLPEPANKRSRIRIIQAMAGAAILCALVSVPYRDFGSPMHQLIELSGLVLLLVCVFGRLWSILYVGHLKNRELVTCGPYSVTRNPLYLFSTIGAAGAGLLFGSLILSATFTAVAYVVLRRAAEHEAAFLLERFGRRYEAYAGSTPLFWPNLPAYQDAVAVTFSPRALRRTFIDGLYFLAVLPLAEAVKFIRHQGYLPQLLTLF